MKIIQIRHIVRASALLVTALLISGCGSSSSGSSPSSSDSPDANATIVSRGLITGFGSVYVNGRKFRTNGTTFSIDDDDSLDESALKVGMIVTVTGSKDDDEVNGHATHIHYDNELKGPVADVLYELPADPANSTMVTMTIFGHPVTANLDTTIDDDGDLTFATIVNDQVLEVSGYATDMGLLATHIELQTDPDPEFEIKGYIDDSSLTDTRFTIKGFPISYDDTTPLDDIAALANGLLVEVKGRLNIAGDTLIAREIEGEHEGLDEDMDEAEIQGEIYAYNDFEKTFKILDQRINANGAELYPSTLVLNNEVIVEVEGKIIEGVLFADEIEQKGKKIKIYATLSAAPVVSSDGSGSISFNFGSTDIVVRVNRQTELEDDINDTDITLADLMQGDFVEMEAFDDGSGVINAVEIELKLLDEIRIVAPVEAKGDESNPKVTLLGVEFDLSGASYENELDQAIPAGDFYDALVIGGFIKIKDATNDGIFEKAELDD